MEIWQSGAWKIASVSMPSLDLGSSLILTYNIFTNIRPIQLPSSSFYSSQWADSNGISIDRMVLILVWILSQPAELHTTRPIGLPYQLRPISLPTSIQHQISLPILGQFKLPNSSFYSSQWADSNGISIDRMVLILGLIL